MKRLKGNWKLIWFMAFLLKITLKLFVLFFIEREHSSGILNHPVSITFLDCFFSPISTNETVQHSNNPNKIRKKRRILTRQQKSGIWFVMMEVMMEVLLPLKCIMNELTRLFFYYYELVKHANMK